MDFHNLSSKKSTLIHMGAITVIVMEMSMCIAMATNMFTVMDIMSTAMAAKALHSRSSNNNSSVPSLQWLKRARVIKLLICGCTPSVQHF